MDSKNNFPEAGSKTLSAALPHAFPPCPSALASVQCSGKQNEGHALAKRRYLPALFLSGALLSLLALLMVPPVLLSYFDEDGLTAALGQGAVLTLSAGLILFFPGLGRIFA